jgi:hypothetical protein
MSPLLMLGGTTMLCARFLSLFLPMRQIMICIRFRVATSGAASSGLRNRSTTIFQNSSNSIAIKKKLSSIAGVRRGEARGALGGTLAAFSISSFSCLGCGRYQDYLNETATSTSTAYVLQGGVKAWLEKYADEEELVDKD